MRVRIDGKFISASRNGKYVRGQMISGAGGVQGFYIDTEKDDGEAVAEVVMGMGELQGFDAEADVFANTPRGGGSPYLSVKLVGIKLKGRAPAAS